MILSINQPAYLPWLGYYHRIAISDVHIVLDHVQFEKNSVTNRNKIKTSQGSVMLTVPVSTKGQFGELAINKLTIANNTKWSKKHKLAIQQSYAKAPYFKEIFPFIESTYDRGWNCLNDLLQTVNTHFLQYLNINTEIVYSSNLDTQSNKELLILELCEKLKATKYISGPFGRDYLNEENFLRKNIELVYHDYQHPTYQQLHGNFEPYLSILDLLMNQGKESINILKKK